jgi:hypothetical protein
LNLVGKSLEKLTVQIYSSADGSADCSSKQYFRLAHAQAGTEISQQFSRDAALEYPVRS